MRCSTTPTATSSGSARAGPRRVPAAGETVIDRSIDRPANRPSSRPVSERAGPCQTRGLARDARAGGAHLRGSDRGMCWIAGTILRGGHAMVGRFQDGQPTTGALAVLPSPLEGVACRRPNGGPVEGARGCMRVCWSGEGPPSRRCRLLRRRKGISDRRGSEGR